MDTLRLRDEADRRDAVLAVVAREQLTPTALVVLLIDDHDTIAVAAVVDDTPSRPTEAECRELIEPLAVAAAELLDGGSLLVGLVRGGDPALGETDRCWLRAVQSVCTEHAVRPLGVEVVTRYGVCTAA
jgi:hypothetical protein